MRYLLVASSILMAACGGSSPTAPRQAPSPPALTANQQTAVNYSVCWTKNSPKGEAKVQFRDGVREIPCNLNPNETCHTAAEADMLGNRIIWYNQWLHDPDRTPSQIRSTAAHEATHIRHLHPEHDEAFWLLMGTLMSEEDCP